MTLWLYFNLAFCFFPFFEDIPTCFFHSIIHLQTSESKQNFFKNVGVFHLLKAFPPLFSPWMTLTRTEILLKIKQIPKNHISLYCVKSFPSFPFFILFYYISNNSLILEPQEYWQNYKTPLKCLLLLCACIFWRPTILTLFYQTVCMCSFFLKPLFLIITVTSTIPGQ